MAASATFALLLFVFVDGLITVTRYIKRAAMHYRIMSIENADEFSQMVDGNGPTLQLAAVSWPIF